MFELIWKNAAPPHVQCFGWLAYLGKVKTSDLLLRIGVIHSEEDAICKFCDANIESLDHLLLQCKPVWDVWAAILE